MSVNVDDLFNQSSLFDPSIISVHDPYTNSIPKLSERKQKLPYISRDQSTQHHSDSFIMLSNIGLESRSIHMKENSHKLKVDSIDLS